ncbi:Hypothetical predicted protein [Olea europaea subsp. europaea]|uniref:Uncharacterized protein n=1 Tax=Olea europaea subsp. europaea TaxID=158383 RepID=A0A8S0PTN5_OLEEU|nr:Hypothetical predicted protein [Olea europaea subsp. europaea]
MVKFLRPNNAAVLLQGRFAGQRTTIVKNFNDSTGELSSSSSTTTTSCSRATRSSLTSRDYVCPDAPVSLDKNVTSCKEINVRFEERSKTGKGYTSRAWKDTYWLGGPDPAGPPPIGGATGRQAQPFHEYAD